MPSGSIPMSKRKCGACGEKGHRADYCPKKKGNGARPAAKPTPKPDAAVADAFDLVNRISALQDQVARGKDAETKLAQIKKALAGI